MKRSLEHSRCDRNFLPLAKVVAYGIEIVGGLEEVIRYRRKVENFLDFLIVIII